MVPDDAHLEWDAGRFGEAERGRHAGIRNRHDHVSIGRRFKRELIAHAAAHFIDRAALDEAVGAGEVDVFEDARARRARREGTDRLDAFFADHHNFAIVDLADKFSADDVKRAGFRGEDIGLAVTAEDQRAQADGVACADQLLAGDADEGITAFNLVHGIDQAFNKALLRAARDQVEDHFGVHGGLEDRAIADEFLAQDAGIGQVAVMRYGETACIKVCEDRLDVAGHRAALRGVPVVADGGVAGKALAKVSAKALPHKAHMALGGETLAVKADDAGRFLPSVLQGVKPQGCQQTCFKAAKDSENAAFFAGFIVIMIEKDHRTFRLCWWGPMPRRGYRPVLLRAKARQ